MFLEALAIGQGIFYILTGIWPIADISSFQKVTGPKTDLWLVRTVGVLIAVVGTSLLSAGLGGGVGYPVLVLAVGCAAALTLVDVIYVSNGTISKIYLLDAAVEILIVISWFVAALSGGLLP